jgi:hypothetical protein
MRELKLVGGEGELGGFCIIFCISYHTYVMGYEMTVFVDAIVPLCSWCTELCEIFNHYMNPCTQPEAGTIDQRNDGSVTFIISILDYLLGLP